MIGLAIEIVLEQLSLGVALDVLMGGEILRRGAVWVWPAWQRRRTRRALADKELRRKLELL